MLKQESLNNNWNSVIDAVKKKYKQVAGEDLAHIQRNADQLIGVIQRKTGETREQIEKFLDESASSASNMYRQVVNRAGEMANQAGEAMHEGYEQLSERAEQGYDYAKETVANRPIESIAVVAGVSLLAGIVIGVSMCSRR